MSRTWFDKFWTHEDICPRLKYLLEDFDEVRQEFLDNKDKLVWNSWNYGLKRYQKDWVYNCLLYTSPSPRDRQKSRMPSSA